MTRLTRCARNQLHQKSGETGVGEVLAVGCWDQTLSFYLSDGTQHLKDRKLHFYPWSTPPRDAGSVRRRSSFPFLLLAPCRTSRTVTTL
jgi:hypothetical protein